MQFIEVLQASTPIFMGVVILLGLLIGSFLNVVIYRLPEMMQQECASFNGIDTPEQERFTLISPRSRCSNCGHNITAIENIPVISYIFLRGKCRDCKSPISLRYPTIESLTGVLSGIIAWHFGYDWSCLGALLLTWSLVALTFIDVDHQLLPDSITLPLLWLGIIFNLFSVYTDLVSSVIGAISGYLILWLVFHTFKLITGKEGMGYGDFKLLAALGAWLGWKFLPSIILLSSLVGAIVGITLVLSGLHKREIPIPFGPYLAAAGWIALIWGNDINTAYLSLAGLN